MATYVNNFQKSYVVWTRTNPTIRPCLDLKMGDPKFLGIRPRSGSSSKLCLLAHFTAAYKLDQRRGSVVWIFCMVHRKIEATIIFRKYKKLNFWTSISKNGSIKPKLMVHKLWTISYGWHCYGWIKILILKRIESGKTRSIDTLYRIWLKYNLLVKLLKF